MPLLHDRTAAHTGVEDTQTTVLAGPIGRYAAGTNLHTVLADMVARLAFIEANCGGVFIHAITANAVIWNAAGVTADAYIHQGGAAVLGADAVIAGSQARTITGNAFLLAAC